MERGLQRASLERTSVETPESSRPSASRELEQLGEEKALGTAATLGCSGLEIPEEFAPAVSIDPSASFPTSIARAESTSPSTGTAGDEPSTTPARITGNECSTAPAGTKGYKPFPFSGSISGEKRESPKFCEGKTWKRREG